MLFCRSQECPQALDKSPLSTGQSFYSRVLENCEEVADFDEVGYLSPASLPPLPLMCRSSPWVACVPHASSLSDFLGGGGGWLGGASTQQDPTESGTELSRGCRQV